MYAADFHIYPGQLKLLWLKSIQCTFTYIHIRFLKVHSLKHY